MKTIIKITPAAFAAALVLISCSLKEELTSQASPDSFFRNEQQCKAALNSSYFQIKSIYNYPFFYAVECCTDLMFCPSTNKEARMQISPSDPGVATVVWNQSYYAIKNANCSIARISKSPLDEDVKKSLLAEGKIMRAFYYYLLTSFFGDVPFWEDEIVTSDDLSRITSLPRMSAVETRDKLISELNECVQWLPQERFCQNKENRAGAPMGYMLIAKMAMWNKEWNTAVAALEKLADIYGDLSQYPLSDVPFSVKNAPESIFEIQHKYVNGGIDFTMSLACICEPMREIGTDIYDGVSIPELGDRSTTYTAARPTAYYLSNYITRESADMRREMTLAWSYNGQPFNSVGTRPWLGPKFWCWGMESDSDGNNYKLFRYADAVLMLAECYAEAGRKDEAVAELNKVKTRAGIKPYPRFKTREAFLEELMLERGRELIGEFHRKFDLVRWGNWYFQTSSYNDYSFLKNIHPWQEYFPIPDTEIALSGYNLDNNAYIGGQNR